MNKNSTKTYKGYDYVVEIDDSNNCLQGKWAYGYKTDTNYRDLCSAIENQIDKFLNESAETFEELAERLEKYAYDSTPGYCGWDMKIFEKEVSGFVEHLKRQEEEYEYE